jgi:tRNA dimethylallyltransferase
VSGADARALAQACHIGYHAAMQTILLVLGPTASGKSLYAIERAAREGGEIVNMDSMQVYQDLSILTARPQPEQCQGIAHHLFGHVDAATPYSTGLWLEEAKAAIEGIQSRGNRPILVGGTGLYAHALTQGLVPTPPVPADIRARTRVQVGADPKAAHARLMQIDAQAGQRIQPKDIARIARALEVYDSTGRTLSDWHTEPAPPILAQDTWEGVALMPDRDALYARIHARFDAMMAAGGLNEAHALWQRQLDPDLPAMKAVGLPPLADFFAGHIPYEDATSRAILDTRHYAKRQITWIRNRAVGWEILGV